MGGAGGAGAGGKPSMLGTSGALATAGTRSVGGSTAAGGSPSAGAPSLAGAGGIDWAACSPGDTCLLATQTSCGAGCEPVPLSRFIPLNGKYEAEYYRQQPMPPCIDIGCASVPAGAANVPNYYAACSKGRCQGFDVRTGPLSACSSDSECYLRSGTSCCGCGRDNPIAVSSKVDVEAVFCASSAGCDADCTSGPWSPSAEAYCSQGHCLVDSPVVISEGGAPP